MTELSGRLIVGGVGGVGEEAVSDDSTVFGLGNEIRAVL